MSIQQQQIKQPKLFQDLLSRGLRDSLGKSVLLLVYTSFLLLHLAYLLDLSYVRWA